MIPLLVHDAAQTEAGYQDIKEVSRMASGMTAKKPAGAASACKPVQMGHQEPAESRVVLSAACAERS